MSVITVIREGQRVVARQTSTRVVRVVRAGSQGPAATVEVGTVTTGAAGSSASVVNSGTSSAAVLDITIPRGNTGATGNNGAAATIAVGTVTTGAPGSSVVINNVGSSSAAVFDIAIPRGDQGASGSGSGDVIGPASAVDNRVVFFDGATGKQIKDSGLGLSGTNTGDETGARIATLAHAAADKATPVDADEIAGTDSASSFSLIRMTIANLKAMFFRLISTLNFTTSATPPTPAAGEATMYAESVGGIARLRVLHSSGNNFALFRDSGVQRVKNVSGGSVTRGQLAYFTVAPGAGMPGVALAQANAAATMPAGGFIVTSAINNANTTVQAFGVLDTLDTSAWAEGAILFASPTVAGGLTDAEPQHPYLSQPVAQVLVSHAVNGQFSIIVTPGHEGDAYGSSRSSFKVGPATGAGAVDLVLSNANTITLRGTPTGAHVLTAPAETGTLLSSASLDTDGTLTANSDTKIATQKAVKTYADQIIAAADAMVFKGVVDCSANPNYPAADRGHTYRISVAGKIGGASGVNVEVGDLILCLTDGTASGDQAGVGSAWSVTQTNLDGAVIGPASAVNNRVVFFDGTTGKLIKDSGVTLAGNNTGDETTTTAGALINSATDKATPVDADYLGLMDSAAGNVLKKLSWANLKSVVGAYIASLTQTLTNKRITPRVGTTTSHATPTINTDNVDIFRITAQAEAITSMTTNLSGTPTDSQGLIIEVTGTAARAITWGASFEASTVALPTTTVSTNKLTVGFMWNSVTSKWRAVGTC